MSTTTLAPRPVSPAGRPAPAPAPDHPRAGSAAPPTPRLRRLPSARRPLTEGAVHGAPPPLPRTSLAAPWDRLRLTWPVPGAAGRSAAPRSDEHPPLAELPADLPDPAAWSAGVVRSCVEALLGVRPATQLERWLSVELYDAVRRRAGLASRTLGPAALPQAPRVRSSRAQVSDDGRSAEVCVVLHDGTRVRAAAARLEVFRGRWRVVALEIG